MPIQLKDVEAARKVISEHIQKTPAECSRSCSKLLGSEIFLKFENLQRTGSFKIRGALNRLSQLSDSEKKKGVIASSAGNHAQGVALSASLVGCESFVVMPTNSPVIKISATEGYGAKVILNGSVYDESYDHAKVLEQEQGYTFIHPYNDPFVMAGQGTIGLEILEQVKNLDSIVIPIGGGGLMSGIATVIKTINPKCKIYAVVSENAPAVYHWFKGDNSFNEPVKPTIADGIAVKKPTPEIMDQYIKKYVDDIVTVSDAEIAAAVVFLLERAKTVAEGCGGTTLAAAMKANWDLGKRSCLLVSGGNVDLNIISSIIEKGLQQRGRLAQLNVAVPDRPGTLRQLTSVIASAQANILQVHHDRSGADLRVAETRIQFVLETRNNEHIEEIKIELRKLGVKI